MYSVLNYIRDNAELSSSSNNYRKNEISDKYLYLEVVIGKNNVRDFIMSRAKNE
jgi:hypothetical protein